MKTMRAVMRVGAAARPAGVRFSSLPAVPEAEQVLPGLRAATTKQRDALVKAKDRKALYWKEKHADLRAHVTFYEELMFPIHEIRNTIYNTWVERCGLMSKIKNTKNAKPEDKAAWEAEYATLGDEIAALEKKQGDYVSATFDTELYNSFLSELAANIEQPGVHATAVRTFHDMTDNKIVFDDKTKMLLKFICFGDSEFQNSDLLFSCIEYPERGAHTFVKDESLEDISSRVVEAAGARHALPMTASDEIQRDTGFLLRPSKKEKATEAIEGSN